MVKNLDWLIFTPDSLHYKRKLENAVQAFSYVHCSLKLHMYFPILRLITLWWITFLSFTTRSQYESDVHGTSLQLRRHCINMCSCGGGGMGSDVQWCGRVTCSNRLSSSGWVYRKFFGNKYPQILKSVWFTYSLLVPSLCNY